MQNDDTPSHPYFGFQEINVLLQFSYTMVSNYGKAFPPVNKLGDTELSSFS